MNHLFDLPEESKAKVKTLVQRMTSAGTYLLAGWIVFAGLEIHHLSTYAREWSNAQQNLVVIEKVFSDMKDCESGQRGYIITGDTDYLAQYNAGAAALDYDRHVMHAYLEPQASQRDSLAELTRIINAKIAEMQFAIDMFDRDGFAAAQTIIRTNKGAQQMKQIRYLMDVIRAREAAALKQSTVAFP